jgi:hypothetical protein
MSSVVKLFTPINPPVVDDVYDKCVPAIMQLRHNADVDLASRPDYYGPPSKACLKRIAAWDKRNGVVTLLPWDAISLANAEREAFYEQCAAEDAVGEALKVRAALQGSDTATEEKK